MPQSPLVSSDFYDELRAASNNFTISNNPKVTEVLLKNFGALWKDRCERSLLLAKQLGNIYTGSLYNGLLSLICDTSIDLIGKKILMFSYGSGCAASMFVLNVVGDYKEIQEKAQFKHRLESRVKIPAEEFDRWMAHREKMFGKGNYIPQVRVNLFSFGLGLNRTNV